MRIPHGTVVLVAISTRGFICLFCCDVVVGVIVFDAAGGAVVNASGVANAGVSLAGSSLLV